MVFFLSPKKNPLPTLGAGNGFFWFFDGEVRPLPTPLLAGDNNDSDEYDNKAVNGIYFRHVMQHPDIFPYH